MTGSEVSTKSKHDSAALDPYEKNWLKFSLLLLVGFFSVVVVAGFFKGLQVNGDEGRVDPRNVTESAPWDEPGLRKISDGVYEAYIIAQTWSFSPREFEVPVGSEVTIYVTSVDVQHGINISNTNVNMMVVPGQVSKIDYTFDEVGDFPYICHEFCGTGHASMFGVVHVVEADPQGVSE